MANEDFARFNEELLIHDAPGYHVVRGTACPEDARAVVPWAPEEYLALLSEVGFGQFFGGRLILFSPTDVQANSATLPSGVVAIGYDGTTSGVYALKDGEGSSVYWWDWEEGASQRFGFGIFEWIESSPGELFDEKLYRGFGKIRDPGGVEEVLREREKVLVRLVGWEPDLVRPPGREDALLPRYHLLHLSVELRAPTVLHEYTFRVLRLGSRYGKDNVEYVTIKIPADSPIEKQQGMVAYVFDPFNVPFDELRLEGSPSIDLTSKMRVRYAELSSYL